MTANRQRALDALKGRRAMKDDKKGGDTSYGGLSDGRPSSKRPEGVPSGMRPPPGEASQIPHEKKG
jgi:hypothetical protein